MRWLGVQQPDDEHVAITVTAQCAMMFLLHHILSAIQMYISSRSKKTRKKSDKNNEKFLFLLKSFES